MAYRIRNLAAVKVKSRELDIPYRNLLSAFIMEEMIVKISESEEVANLWLKNDSMLSLDSYKKKVPYRLEYVWGLEEPCTVRNVIHHISHVFQNEKQADLWWKYRVEKVEDVIVVYVQGKIDELQIPVEIRITEKPAGTMAPVKQELRLFLQNDKQVEYYRFPVEGMLAEYFVKTLELMELIPDMGYYYQLYDMLHKEICKTRKVTESIQQHAQTRNIEVSMMRFQKVADYKQSPYMKKRWKAYLKQQKRDNPSWEEVMDLWRAYFEPLWQALSEGTIYLGDWMPELMRYLD